MSESKTSVVSRSFQALKRLWPIRAEFISWSNLSIYGNNPIVKLAILAPLIAQVLIHQEIVPFLAKYDFTNLGWLYAALMCFFVAQLIYSSFLCHRDIKDYPSEIKFTQAMEATTPDSDLNLDYFDVYKKYFKKYDGVIDQDRYDTKSAVDYVAKQSLKNTRPSYMSVDSVDLDLELVQETVATIIVSIKNGKQYKEINWNSLGKPSSRATYELFQIDLSRQEDGSSNREEFALHSMVFQAQREFSSSHWRAEAIKRRYDKLNLRNLPARIIAAILYGVGTAYFIWIGALNVYKVLDQYGWIEPIKPLI